ncbi:MAG TPA: Rieske 2Fe-2S domain-containing protein [Gaiellaceae bacterium]|nr:Rieske 2Fe-2S domain-containing protein [Gaiellaceae bacterium]
MEPPEGDGQRDQPTPSLWPIGLAVGVVCLLVGLVVSWVAVAVGAALFAIFGFLWARDVASGHRAPEAEAAEAEATPAAGEEPAERFPRNVFLETATIAIGALIGLIVTAPVLAASVLNAFLKQHGHDVDLGPIENFPEGQYMIATFQSDPHTGTIGHRSAFIRYNGPKDGEPSFTCISNRCVHLGCPVQPGGPTFDKEQKKVPTKHGPVTLVPSLPAAGFICPCHGGAYDQEGNRIAGPPTHALNRFEFSIVDGRLVLQSLYSVSHVEGTGANAQITKYVLTGPGQHVDGPEAWLYPLQPPH